MQNRIRFTAIFLILPLVSLPCDRAGSSPQGYINEINSWHEKRVERLQTPDGWLTLAGLFWLEQGKNSFGSDEKNDIVFPSGIIPDYCGFFELSDTSVTMHLSPEFVPSLKNQNLQGSVRLKPDVSGSPDIIHYNNLSWFIIKRGERYGIRLRDNQHPNLRNFKGITRFPVNTGWKIRALFIPYAEPRSISVPTVLGTAVEENCPGYLEFEIQGKQFRLDPLADSPDDRFFIIFGDLTNGESTYGAGRFLTAEPPDANGIVMLDFNRAYNPPCAFTEFATCPLPPAQNRIDLKITAGEHTYRGDH